MFQPDAGPDRKVRQEWLIDRVLNQGGLWIGRSARSPTNELGPPGRAMTEKDTSADDSEESREPDDSNHSSLSASIPRITEGPISDSSSSGSYNNDTLSLCKSGSDGPGITQPVAASETTHASLNLVHGPTNKKHSWTMFLNSVLMKIFEEVSLEHDDEEGKIEGSKMNLGAFMTIRLFPMVNFAIAASRLDVPHARFAVFDVNGNALGEVLVLTPY